MPLLLPAPTTPREAAAQAFIAQLDQRLPLFQTTPPTHIVKHTYLLAKELDTPPDVMGCAGRFIAQYLPIIGLDNQWAFLVPLVCPPPQPINNNTTALSPQFFPILLILHRHAMQRLSTTQDEFKAYAHTIIDPIVKDTNIPEPPFTLDIIEPIRRGYAMLAEFFFSL